MSLQALCFVDMPFEKKQDPSTGVEIDFDQVYNDAIKPAILAAGLDAIRGDEERTGGIIHAPMFARLLLSEYVVADLTLANPNVFYELGIRHAARPFTTVPIFANIHPLPFDVAMVRAIGYTLENGKLTAEAASALKAAITARLLAVMEGPAVKDSPLFQLIPDFPGIDLPHEVTEAFQDRVKHEDEFRLKLAEARGGPTDAQRAAALLQVQESLGNLKAAQPGVLVDLMLSYRDVSAWDLMVRLCDAFPDYLKDYVVVRQQWALALNRRKLPGDRDRAISMLDKLLKERGPDPETLGILGRVHKDRYRELKAAKNLMATAALDDAIGAYKKGFESDPRDYYPGVNAISLMIEKGDLKQAEQMLPLVNFAVARRGGAASSDYWDLATVLELAAIGSDWKSANAVLPRTLAAAKFAWHVQTTIANLEMLQQAREGSGTQVPQLVEIIGYLKQRAVELGEAKL
jgi:tetratricopeptide (TPR) repeat protein